MAAQRVKIAQLVRVRVENVDDAIGNVLEQAPRTIRPLLERSVTTGRAAFDSWFTNFYEGHSYASENSRYRPVLLSMIRRLLTGGLSPGERPDLAYAKAQIEADRNAWQTVAERFVQRNPES